MQFEILQGGASKALKKNGLLVYATCSQERVETTGVLKRFLAANPDFALEGKSICTGGIKGMDYFCSSTSEAIMKNQYFCDDLFAFAYGFFAEVETKDYMFSEGHSALEGGEAYPWGHRRLLFNPLYTCFRARILLSLLENTYGLVQFGYAYFRTQDYFKRFPGVYQFHG